MKTLRATLILCLILSPTTAFASSGRTVTGKVVEATDGETVTVETQNNQKASVRIFGISAPKKGQPLYDISRKHLNDLASGKDVTITVKQLDEDNNYIGVVRAGDSDLGAQMVRDGAAWHYVDEAPVAETDLGRVYSECQEAARKERRGVWAEDNPAPPWEFARKQAEEYAKNHPELYVETQRKKFDNAIRKQQVMLGMDYDDVVRAWGAPYQQDTVADKDGPYTVCLFAAGKVTFVDGLVTRVVLLRDIHHRR